MPIPAELHSDAHARWQAHIDAGRLAAASPAPPTHVVANRAATDALFRAIAAHRRSLARSTGEFAA